MPEHSLEDLKTVSLPALRDAELVNFGRAESPSKAYELAFARWPRRQAKAVRFLAILRRDYGNEAFEAFLMEHARPQGTEHAQGAKVMESFDHIFPGGLTGAVISGNGHDPQKLGLYRHNRSGEGQHEFLSDIARRHNLRKSEVGQVVHQVVAASFELWARAPETLDPESCAAACLALIYYSQSNDETEALLKKLLLLMVKAAGRSDYPRDLIKAAVTSDHLPAGGSVHLIMQDVINGLLQNSRITPEELGEAWVEMLRIRDGQNYISEVNAPFWYGLTIGDKSVSVLAQDTIRAWAMRDVEAMLATGFGSYNQPEVAAAELEKLLTACDHKWLRSEEVVVDVENHLVVSMAEGHASRVAYFLNRYGKLFGFHDGGGCSRIESEVAKHLQRLARGAVAEAERRYQYGIGSALAEYLSDHETADRLRAAARAQKQRVGLNWSFYVG